MTYYKVYLKGDCAPRCAEMAVLAAARFNAGENSLNLESIAKIAEADKVFYPSLNRGSEIVLEETELRILKNDKGQQETVCIIEVMEAVALKMNVKQLIHES